MTIEIPRTLAATPERVFHALTDADDLSHWWTTTAESDPRTGGSFSYGFEFEDATRDHTYTGTYHDVTPAESVSYPWQTGLGETTVDVRLRPAGTGTELTLVHRGWGEGADWRRGGLSARAGVGILPRQPRRLPRPRRGSQAVGADGAEDAAASAAGVTFAGP